MFAEDPVEEVLVAVLEGFEPDVALERIALAHDVLVGAARLLVEAGDRRGQQPGQLEALALLEREGGALVVHGLREELFAAVGNLDDGPFVGLGQFVVSHGAT